MIGSSITVGASATAIITVASASVGNANYPSSAIIKNPIGGTPVYLGGPTVDTTGYPLNGGEIISIDLLGEPLYGITGGGNQTIYTLRRGLTAP